MKFKTKLISVSVAALAITLSVVGVIHSNSVKETKATGETSADWNNVYTGSYTGTYYDNITATSGKDLQDQLTSLLSSFTKVSYDGLFDVYPDSDARPEDNTVFDMYADWHFPLNGKKCGNQQAVGDCWNREHSIPKSWWGGGTNDKYSDAHHLIPTDGRVNNWRSNYKLGIVTNPGAKTTYTFANDIVGVSKFGKDANGENAFEPADVYKGDLARIYFYFATRYQGGATSGDGAKMFSSSQSHFYLTEDAEALFLKWHKADPVSIKEVNRNNGVYKHQKNRNPFIDHPEYVEAIWEGTPATSDKVILNKSTLTFAADSEGEKLTATSSDGSTISWTSINTGVATVSVATSASGTEVSILPVAAGTTTITASATINGTVRTATCFVQVTKALKSLTCSGSPTKTSYYVGDTFDSQGLTVTATYTDNSTENVTDQVEWSPTPLNIDTASVTGSFGNLSVTVTGLTVTTRPTPTGNTFSKVESVSDISAGDNLVIASYSNKTVAGTLSSSYLQSVSASSAFNNDGSKITSLPSNTSVFAVGGSSSAFTLTSSEGQLYSSGAKNLNFSNKGNGTWTIVINSSGALIENGNTSNGFIRYNSSAPRFTTYASGQEAPDLYKQDMAEASLVSIALTNVKTSYYVGDAFVRPTVTATYDDSHTADVSDSVTYSGHDLSTAGDYTVTASYTENGVTKTATFDIEVIQPASIVGLNYEGSPTKTSYYHGDSFNPSGIIVYASYDDYSTKEVTSSVIWSPNPLTAGTTSVTGSYQGLDITVSGISVSPLVLSSVSLTGQTTEYNLNDSFSFTGTCTAHYNSGASKPVTPTSVSSPDMSTAGNKTVTVSYTEGGVTKTANYTITVTETPFVNSIEQCYSKSSGASVSNVYGLYVGSGDGKSPIIMNGSYGITLYNTSFDYSSWVENQTYVKVSGSMSIYTNSLYEITSYSATKITDSTEIKKNVAPINLYEVTGDESTSDLTIASRLCLLTGKVTAVTTSVGNEYSATFSIGSKSVTLFVKKNNSTQALANALNDSKNNNKEISLKGYTGFYKTDFQVYAKEAIKASSSYSAENFASDLLSMTNSICESGTNKEIELSAVWTTLQIEKWSLLESSQRTTLINASASESGTTIQQAMARYDRICTKYASCSNFIGRSGANAANINKGIISNSNTMLVVLLVSTITITSVGTFLFLKKKKKHNLVK